jgi:hypothetical protein
VLAILTERPARSAFPFTGSEMDGKPGVLSGCTTGRVPWRICSNPADVNGSIRSTSKLSGCSSNQRCDLNHILGNDPNLR